MSFHVSDHGTVESLLLVVTCSDILLTVTCNSHTRLNAEPYSSCPLESLVCVCVLVYVHTQYVTYPNLLLPSLPLLYPDVTDQFPVLESWMRAI